MSTTDGLDVEVSRLRVPPNSQEAEQFVLGALMLDNDAFDSIAFLTESSFWQSRHRLVWAALVKGIASGKTMDGISLITDLGSRLEEAGGASYVIALTNTVVSSRNIRRHAEIVRDKAKHRKLISTMDEAASLAWGEGEVSQKVDQIGSMVGDLAKEHVRKVPRSIGEIALERTQVYEDLQAGKVAPGWRTHIPWLNAALNGGFRAGGLYILAARPSVGKSSFSQELAMQMAVDGVPAMFLSQEMSEAEVADRGVSNMGRLSYSALLTGDMKGDAWDRAAEALHRLGSLPFTVDDQANLSLQDIRLKAKSSKGLKVLVLDYLQLCASTRKDGNRNSEIEEISRGLKTLAKELGIAILALSQLNRDVEKRASKKPGLSDLRDSGAIEQDADVVMFLWPVREFEGEGRKIVGLGIDKNRQGRLGQVGLDFYGDVQRWTQSTADINPAPIRQAKEL